MTAGEDIAPLLQHAPHGVSMSDLVRLTGRAVNCIPLPSEAIVIRCGP